MSIRTSKKNRTLSSDVVSKTKMFHTNKGWMASTSKALQLGIAAGVSALTMSGLSMVASADTIPSAQANSNASDVTSNTSSVSTAKDVMNSNVKDEASNSNVTSKDTTSNFDEQTSEDKASNVSNTTSSSTEEQKDVAKTDVNDSTDSSKSESKETVNNSEKENDVDKDQQNVSSTKDDTTSNTTSTDTSKAQNESSVANDQKNDDQSVNNDLNANDKTSVVQDQSSNTDNSIQNNESSTNDPVENNKDQSLVNSNDSVQNNEQKDNVIDDSENNSDQEKDSEENKNQEIKIPETSNDNSVLDNDSSDTTKTDDTVQTVSPSKTNDSLSKEQLDHHMMVSNAVETIKDNTFFTEKQKKALEELITTGKTQHPEDLPSNVMIDNGKVVMFIRGNDDQKVYLAIKDAQDSDPFGIASFASEKGQTGIGTTYGPETHLSSDKNVFTTHMTITSEDGHTWDAWCLQPMAQGPFEATGQTASGSQIKMTINKLDSKEMMNKYAALIGCAWYGYEGPAAIDKNTDEFNLYTHLAMSVVAWDTNFSGLRDYQIAHNQANQQMIDQWRNIPQVKAILDKAKTFNADTMKNFKGQNYSFQAYEGHGIGSDGQMIPNSQDLFSVQWMKTPVQPTITTTTDHKENVPVGDQVKVSDTIQIGNLQKNQDYKVIAQLVDKNTGKVLGTYETSFNSGDSQDKSITATVTVSTANTKGNLTWKTQLTPSDSSLPGATHNEDLSDKSETTGAPSKVVIGTTATGADGSKDIGVGQNVQINDKVHYEGLNPGEQYVVQGTLMDKETGKVVQVNGKDVTATTIFTADQDGEGDVNVIFVLPDDIDLQGHDIVAFEKVYGSKGSLVGSHEDINDEGQTVHIGKADLHTLATDKNNSHNIVASEHTTIIDQIQYHDLIPGQKYTVKGTLMDKTTGKPVVDANGKVVTVEKTFVPTTPDGTVSVEFNFDGRNYAGHTLVAFEDLYDASGKLIEKHEDINDSAETVYLKSPETPQEGTSVTPPTPNIPEKPDTPESPKPTARVGTPSPKVVTPQNVTTIKEEVPVQKEQVVTEKSVQVGTPAPAEGTPQIGSGESVSLPQTGDNDKGLAMLAAFGLISGLGMAGLRKRKDA